MEKVPELKKPRTNVSPALQDWNENAKLDVKALQRERDRLLKALERTREEKKRLRKETNRLLSEAKSLSRILDVSHPQPEYLRREE